MITKLKYRVIIWSDVKNGWLVMTASSLSDARSIWRGEKGKLICKVV